LDQFLASLLDFFEIAFIALPLIAPIAHKSGIDMVWLTILLAVNLQTSFMHPPFWDSALQSPKRRAAFGQDGRNLLGSCAVSADSGGHGGDSHSGAGDRNREACAAARCQPYSAGVAPA